MRIASTPAVGAEPAKIDILLIENSAHDAELAQIVLERHGYKPAFRTVRDGAAMRAALARQQFDIILSDYILPAFSGTQALELANRFAPDTPFIFFSGIVGEAHAVEMMRLGATDYVLKQNLSLLPKAVGRALTEVFERRERLRVEAELRALELRSRLAIDAARLGMWELEPATQTLTWDARCRELFGLQADDSVSLQVFRAHCHPEDGEHLSQGLDAAIKVGIDHDYQHDCRVIREGGRIGWVSLRGRAIFCKGVCDRIIGVMMDITPEKLATQALEAQNEALGERVEKRTRERNRTWEVSRDMLAVCRFDTTPVALNPAWEDTLGWERAALMRRPLADFVHPDDVMQIRALSRRMARGEAVPQFTNRVRHIDGSWRWISWMGVPDNDMVYIAGRDITRDIAAVEALAAVNRKLNAEIEERERVEITLRQMQRMEAIGQLTAGVAHDFNNLLVIILNNAAILGRELAPGDDAALHPRLKNICEAGERGAKLTAQLLAFSRRQQLASKPVDINETIKGMLTLLQSTLGPGIHIEIHESDGVEAAMADPTQLELIVLNLCLNARDAMPGGGTLSLRTANHTIRDAPRRAEDPEPGDYVALSVQDNGTGMTSEVLAKAFEPFFTTKEIGKGSGLGLPQVFGFAKQTGGGAAIDTRLGQGTTVTVYLPSAGGAPALAPESVSGNAPERAACRHLTVLLVDDEPGVREVTGIMLEDAGHAVLSAANGMDALAILRTGAKVDILLTDLAMPGMNGAELAQAAQTQRPRLPVVFVTGYAKLDGVDTAEAQVLQKPFHSNELLQAISRACEDPRQPPDISRT